MSLNIPVKRNGSLHYIYIRLSNLALTQRFVAYVYQSNVERHDDDD